MPLETQPCRSYAGTGIWDRSIEDLAQGSPAIFQVEEVEAGWCHNTLEIFCVTAELFCGSVC